MASEALASEALASEALASEALASEALASEALPTPGLPNSTAELLRGRLTALLLGSGTQEQMVVRRGSGDHHSILDLETVVVRDGRLNSAVMMMRPVESGA